MSEETKRIVDKIEKESAEKERLYDDNHVLVDCAPDIQTKREEEKKKYLIAGKILGRILDKIELAEEFCGLIPLYYDETGCFWMFNNNLRYWNKIDDIDVLNMVHASSESNIVNSKERAEIINALKQVARTKKPLEIARTSIQFQKEIVDLSSGDRFPSTAKYFSTNPIPWRLGSSEDTPRIDELFKSWVKEEDVPKLYEIFAYCMLSDYPIERIFVLHGAGSNGKSVYRSMLRKFIGEHNCVSTSFEVLNKSRFERTKVFKKLICEMGETNFNKIENTELIKKLVSGKDLVGGEEKNKKPFDFINYAKIIISTNSLPPTEDKTTGFYRRWLIIDFPNEFKKECDVLTTIPDAEYENMATKCLRILDELLKKREFTNEGDFEHRRKRYEERSNPFDKFFDEFVDSSDPNADILKWEFEDRLNKWLNENKLRQLSPSTISKNMREKGHKDSIKNIEWFDNGEGKRKSVRIWEGIKWKV